MVEFDFLGTIQISETGVGKKWEMFLTTSTAMCKKYSIPRPWSHNRDHFHDDDTSDRLR